MGKCSESKFEFSVSMLSLKGEVDCIFPYCAYTTRVELLEKKVTIFYRIMGDKAVDQLIFYSKKKCLAIDRAFIF